MKGLLSILLLLSWSAAPSVAQPLVSGKWLAKRACHRTVAVLDLTPSVDGKRIPCAVVTDYKKDKWRVTRGKIAGLLPSEKELERLLGKLGLKPTSHVVIVPLLKSLKSVAQATRVYWTLKVLGHKKVSILDGGVSAFLAAGGRLKQSAQTVKPTQYRVNTNSKYLVKLPELHSLRQKKIPFVDARPGAFHLGQKKSKKVARAGTIPGASNLSFKKLLDPKSKRFVSKKQAGKLFSELKLKSGPRVFFCNTGHTASLVWFVSSEILGHRSSRIYDGSMIEWASDPKRPVKK